MSTLVVIPAYNEEKNIRNVISSVHGVLPSANILVVNDGSSDRTLEEASNSSAYIVSHPYNMGYFAALLTSYKFAVENNYDYLLLIDADGQHDTNFLVTLYYEIQNGNADTVIGSRFMGDYKYDMPLVRRIGSKCFQIILYLVTGQKFTDPTSGFKALNRRTFQFLSRDEYLANYPDADVLLLSYLKGLKIKEIPVQMHPSVNGKKSMISGFKVVYYVYKFLISIIMTLIRAKRGVL